MQKQTDRIFVWSKFPASVLRKLILIRFPAIAAGGQGRIETERIALVGQYKSPPKSDRAAGKGEFGTTRGAATSGEAASRLVATAAQRRKNRGEEAENFARAASATTATAEVPTAAAAAAEAPTATAAA